MFKNDFKENTKKVFIARANLQMFIFPLMQMSMNVHLTDITVMPTRNASTL